MFFLRKGARQVQLPSLSLVFFLITSISAFSQQWVPLSSQSPCPVKTELLSSTEDAITVELQVSFYNLVSASPLSFLFTFIQTTEKYFHRRKQNTAKGAGIYSKKFYKWSIPETDGRFHW